jgi:hypothetical protein
MNRLQDAGIVSDNCVTVADVADGDQTAAVEWLKLNVELSNPARTEKD